MRRHIIRACAAALVTMLWAAGAVPADTTVSGEVKEDQTWSGRILITGDVTIAEATVTVTPGTEVVFAPTDPRHHCIVSIGRNRADDKAALIIEGTKDRPVLWHSKVGSSSGAIAQKDNGGRFHARHACFTGLGFDKTRAINCESRGDGDKFLIEKCAFRDCTTVRAKAAGRGTVAVRYSRFTRRSLSGFALSLSAPNGRAIIGGNAVVGQLHGGGDVVRIVENVLIGHVATILPGGRDVEVRGNIVNVNHDGGYTMLTQSKSYERLRIIDNYFRGSAWQMLGGATGAREVIVRGNVFEGTAYSFHTHEALIMIPAYAQVSRNLFLDYGVAGHPGCDWPSRRRWAYLNNVCRSIGIGTASKVPAKTKPVVRGNLFLRTRGGVSECIYLSGRTAGTPGGFRADFNCFWETVPSYHPDPGKRRVVHYATADHESPDRHAFVFGKTLRRSPGFGLNDLFPGGPVDQEVEPMVVDPWVNVRFTNEEIFTGRITVYDLLLAMRRGFVPRPNSPLINMADPRENDDPLVTDGRADIGAVELSSWPAERKRLEGRADGIRRRWKDLRGNAADLINAYHDAPAGKITSDFEALLRGTKIAPASVEIWVPWNAARGGVGQTKPFGTFEAINWLLYMIEGVRDKPALIRQAVGAYEKGGYNWIGIALAHSGDPAAVDFLVNVLKARSVDRNRGVQRLAAGLKEGLGLIGRQHALEPLLTVAQEVDPEVSVRVARLLAHFGGKDAAAAVVAMHANKRFARQTQEIAHALRWVNGSGAAPVLAGVLRDRTGDASLRAAAARGLGRIGGEHSLTALLDVLVSPDASDELARVIGEGLATMTRPSPLPQLQRLHQAPAARDNRVRSRVAHALAAQRDPQLVEQLCAIISDAGLEEYARVRAAITLGQLADRKSVKHLAGVLRRPAPTGLRKAAAAALGRMNDPAAATHLSEGLLTAQQEDVANACAGALGLSGGRAAAASLLEGINRPDVTVRNTAALSLGRVGGKPGGTALVKLLRSNDATTRASAAEGLELMAPSLDKGAIDALGRVATSDTEVDYVKEAAALALAATGSPLARPTLERILTNRAGETIYIRKIASSGLLVKCGTSTPELRATAAATEDGGRSNVGKWCVVGPFPLGGQPGWNKPRPPEAESDFTRTYTVDGKTLAWDFPRDSYGYVKLDPMLGGPYRTDALAYAATRIDVSSDADAVIFLEMDDGVRLWLNGSLVIDEPLRHGKTARRVRKKVHLRKGINELRLKLPQLGGPWGFTVYLGLPEGVQYKSVAVK